MRRMRGQVGCVGARRPGEGAAGGRRSGARRRSGAVRRRRRLPHRRAHGARLDDRLLPAARRRSVRLRRDRRRQRLQRRVRDGRTGGAGDQRRGVPRALPAIGDGRDLRGRGGRRRRGGRHRRRRAHHPQSRAGVRVGRARPRPSATRAAQGGRPTRRRGVPVEATRNGPGARRRRATRTRRWPSPGCGSSTEPPRRCSCRSATTCTPSPTSPATASPATGGRSPSAAACGWWSTPTGCRSTRARSRRPRGACARAATPATATTSPSHLDSTCPAALDAVCLDPQTSGGLLAAAAPAIADRLEAAGFFRIGVVEAGAPAVVLR